MSLGLLILSKLLCQDCYVQNISDNHYTGIYIPRKYLLEKIVCLVATILCICQRQEITFEMFIVSSLNLYNFFWNLNNKPAYVCL